MAWRTGGWFNQGTVMKASRRKGRSSARERGKGESGSGRWGEMEEWLVPCSLNNDRSIKKKTKGGEKRRAAEIQWATNHSTQRIWAPTAPPVGNPPATSTSLTLQCWRTQVHHHQSDEMTAFILYTPQTADERGAHLSRPRRWQTSSPSNPALRLINFSFLPQNWSAFLQTRARRRAVDRHSY